MLIGVYRIEGVLMRILSFGLFLDYGVYLLVLVIERILIIIPENWAYSFGRFLGRIVWLLFKDRREAVIENLTIAFGGEKSSEWIQKTTFKSFEHLGLLVVEFFLIRHWDQGEMSRRITYSDSKDFNLAMYPGLDGICLLTSHFGCFEVSAASVKFCGFKTNLIATGLKNPFLSKFVFSRAGSDSGVTTFPHKGSVKELIERLRAGEMVAMLGDQRGDAERGIFVDYFGVPAPANEIFARFALDGEARVLPICTYRTAPGRYKTTFGPEIIITSSGDTTADLIRVSSQFHKLFEQWLRIAPEQGFWFQRKWRRKKRRR